MLCAYTKDKLKYIACEADKSLGNFYCPECKCIVILKKGTKRIHHFAHKPPVNCIYGTNESDIHYRCKQDIYLALKDSNLCTKVDCEKHLGSIRADVYWEDLKGNKFAIEVQKSSISNWGIKSKMTFYNELKISVLWVLPKMLSAVKRDARDKFNKTIQLVRPAEYHKYLHKLYFGKLYVWNGGLNMKAIHLAGYSYYIERGNWLEDSDIPEETHFYEENYYNSDYGGYTKYSKSKKTIQVYDRTLNLLQDFSSRQQCENVQFDTIDCLILLDNNKPFWKTGNY